MLKRRQISALFRLAAPMAVAATVIAIIIFTASNQEPRETNLLLPVDYANVPDDMILTNFHTDKIAVRIKCRPKHIEKLSKKSLVYPADIYTDLAFDPAGSADAIEPGRYLLPVDKTRIPLGRSTSIVKITPSSLSIRLEKKVTRVFKVTVPYIGETAKGYMALSPVCEPATVALTGAKSLINRIKQLATKPVDLTNANENFKKEVPLNLGQPELFTVAQSIFVVSVQVQPLTGTRTIEQIPIELQNRPGKKVSIEPSTISIDLKGPQEKLNTTTLTDKIHAFMDLEGLKPGVYARHVCIDIPVELVMTNASPRVFTVKIE
ncbi:YbbR-like domain-containing protein [Desulfobacter hydrogenophilus]|uniref:YbbR-like domain-containing protein n=2 Tax=Desulfobacter hydrogenophilus TaxID=2291 RepID=A0A328FCI8_9BACT|nr:YbbR-like domain-containing protein [Desulfobacter hydrogenophilus]QBH12405.1 YbbR-like domain-containing protein [Desulfobacter hydrogenophilus]RAM00757.1 YbbR-like domain-containing protein [Desulfobacter hydrogenophilus]